MKKTILLVLVLFTTICASAICVSAAGSVSKTDISKAYIYIEGYHTYTGSAITPEIKVILMDRPNALNPANYSVTYTNNVNAGTATVTVTGKGDYYGTCSKDFTIETAYISKATISAANLYYSGKAEKPVVTAVFNGKTLVEGKDYTVDTPNDYGAGKTSVGVTGMGNFSSYTSVSYEIMKKPLSMCTIMVSDQEYTGYQIKPTVQVYNGTTALLSSEYNVTYSNNILIGYATVTVTATDSYSANYTGTTSKQFAIRDNISNANFEFGTVIYDGTPKIPTMYVKRLGKLLVNNTDYTYTVTNNINAGYGTIVFTGKGLYKSTVTKQFRIIPKDISSFAEIALIDSDAEYTYTGSAHKPLVKVYYRNADEIKEMVENEEYRISYLNNVKPGNAKVVAYGKGNYKGSIEVRFDIRPETPKITSLEKGKSGKVKIKIKKGPSTCKYKIYRNGKLIKTTNKGAKSYLDKASKTNGKKYVYTIKAVAGTSPVLTSDESLPKVTYYYKAPKIRAYSSGNRCLSASWSKNKKVSGYQLQYSTKSSFSSRVTYNISGRKNTNRLFNGLRAGVRYYYRVRTYTEKIVDVPVKISYDKDGKQIIETEKKKIKYYSDWSNVSSAVPITSSSHHAAF